MSGRAGKVRKKRVSRSAKAGVVFPVSRLAYPRVWCEGVRRTLTLSEVLIASIKREIP